MYVIAATTIGRKITSLASDFLTECCYNITKRDSFFGAYIHVKHATRHLKTDCSGDQCVGEFA